MSRIGKAPVTIPSGVDVKVDGSHITVKGPKGELSRELPGLINVSVEDNQVVCTRPDEERESRSLHGLTRSLVNNMVVGVTDGYKQDMEIFGVGYRVLAKGQDLEFNLGYSHSVPVAAPQGITFAVESATKFSVSGIDKQLVGQVCANIKRLRKHDPYKGKGIRYAGEQVRRKVGKTGK